MHDFHKSLDLIRKIDLNLLWRFVGLKIKKDEHILFDKSFKPIKDIKR